MEEGVKPHEFEEELIPTDSNFEVYSQKGGINLRARLLNLKKYFSAIVGGLVAYIPTPSGNASNRMEFITDPDGQVWYIDATGAAVKLGGGSGMQEYEDLGLITGTTINPAITLPTDHKEWRINLYRSGVRMTYGKDFSSMTDIELVVEADNEPFTLIVIPS